MKTVIIVHKGISTNSDRIKDWGGFTFACGGKEFYAPDGQYRLEYGYAMKDVALSCFS